MMANIYIHSRHLVSLRGSKHGSHVAMMCSDHPHHTRPGPPTSSYWGNSRGRHNRGTGKNGNHLGGNYGNQTPDPPVANYGGGYDGPPDSRPSSSNSRGHRGHGGNRGGHPRRGNRNVQGGGRTMFG
jgi:hypothetical protein